MSQGTDQRLEELLVARAVEGLDSAEAAELEVLLAASEDGDPEAYDAAAAWVWLAAGDADQPMPEDVAERARAALTGDAAATPEAPARRVVPFEARRSVALRTNLGWLAAAAMLVLAVAGWWPRLQQSQPTNLARARAELIETAQDVVRVDWSNTDDPRAQRLKGGYVVWSDSLQKGYMTFRGLPDVDPSRNVYQLWVFDSGRSERYPVDGGVFEAHHDNGEVIIPIHNKLPVQHAKLFAVTLEPPGGVVVSDRDPILWVAQPQSDTT